MNKQNFRLQHAAGKGRIDEVIALLADGAEVDARDAYGCTALMWAARWGHADIVSILLNAGAGIDAQDSDCMTPLMLAVFHGKPSVVRELLKAGADINKKDRLGRNAASLFMPGGESIEKELFKSVCAGNLGKVYLLISKVKDINIVDERGIGSTLLHESVWSGNIEMSEALINAGVDVDKCDKWGTTALMIAAEQGHIDIINILLEAGADINAQDSYGCTALMFAMICSSSRTAEYLIESGANLNITNREGHDAFYYALRSGKKALAFNMLDLSRGYKTGFKTLKQCNVSLVVEGR